MSNEFRALLVRCSREQGMTCGMSRKGHCWDIAVIESFFTTLKSELLEVEQ